MISSRVQVFGCWLFALSALLAYLAGFISPAVAGMTIAMMAVNMVGITFSTWANR